MKEHFFELGAPRNRTVVVFFCFVFSPRPNRECGRAEKTGLTPSGVGKGVGRGRSWTSRSGRRPTSDGPTGTLLPSMIHPRHTRRCNRCSRPPSALWESDYDHVGKFGFRLLWLSSCLCWFRMREIGMELGRNQKWY